MNANSRTIPAYAAVASFARTVMRADTADPQQREGCYRVLYRAAVAILEASPPQAGEYVTALRQAAIREGLRPSSVDSRIRLARQRVNDR